MGLRAMLQVMVASVVWLAVNKPLVLASHQQLRHLRAEEGKNRAEQLVERFRQVAPYPIILVTATRGYLAYLLNFAEALRRARGVKALRELTVIALDDALVKVLPDEMEIIPYKELANAIGFDKDIWNADGGFRKKYLWLFRIQLLAYLLDHDVSVLMNDIDAMWVQDPYKSIFANHPDISIFAQRGAFPGIYKRKWGAAACMGFIYFRATEASKVWISERTPQTKNFPFGNGPKGFDDQGWLNHGIDTAGIRWPANKTGMVPEGHKATEQIGHTTKLLGPQMRIVLLDAMQVVRNCNKGYAGKWATKQLVIEHCAIPFGTKGDRAAARTYTPRHMWFVSATFSPKSKDLVFSVPRNATRVTAWLAALKMAIDPGVKGPLDLASRKQSRGEASHRLTEVQSDLARLSTSRHAVVALQEREKRVMKAKKREGKAIEIALKALHIPETIKKLGKQMDKLLREKAALTAFLQEPL